MAAATIAAKFVLDASAAVELLLNTPAGGQVGRRIASPAQTLHAPHLIDLEIAQALRRYVRARVLADDRAAQALDDLAALDSSRHAHDVLLPRIWDLRRNTTAYDASYLALAEVLPATLLTLDRRLARVPGIRAHVEIVG